MLCLLSTESLLFVSLLWAIVHSAISPGLDNSSINSCIGTMDPVELTYANTLILATAATSLGVALSLTLSNQSYLISPIPSILGLLFGILQIKEYLSLGNNYSDSFNSSTFYSLVALHFIHLCLGIILLLFISNAGLKIHLIQIINYKIAEPRGASSN